MNQHGAQSVSSVRQSAAVSHIRRPHTNNTNNNKMQVFLLFTATSFIGFVAAVQQKGGSFAGPQIKGGIGDGYIYPIKSAGGQLHKHGPPAAQHRTQLTHQSAAPTSVHTFKLIFEQAPHSFNAIRGDQQQPLVKILKIVEAHGMHSPHGTSGHGKAESIETIKLIHVKGQSNCQHAAPQTPPPAPSYQIDLPVSPASSWH